MLQNVFFKCISWLNGSFFGGGGDRVLQKEGVKTYLTTPISPLNLANVSSVCTSIVYGSGRNGQRSRGSRNNYLHVGFPTPPGFRWPNCRRNRPETSRNEAVSLRTPDWCSTALSSSQLCDKSHTDLRPLIRGKINHHKSKQETCWFQGQRNRRERNQFYLGSTVPVHNFENGWAHALYTPTYCYHLWNVCCSNTHVNEDWY